MDITVQLIRLKHHKNTKYFNFKQTQTITLSFVCDIERFSIITFRNLIIPNALIRECSVDGTSRYLFDIPHNILLYNIQSDSPLYAQIFWDIAHRIKILSIIYLIENYNTDCLFRRSYFQNAFQEIKTSDKYMIAFKKINSCIIEANRGLDDWTFGIPVGPENPFFLNKCVERLLQLQIPKKEIILCGTPHKDFIFFDQVRIVGKDIPAPPIHITRKKNTIAQAAKFKNLCIIHDRIMLPNNFFYAIKKFGDDFPITGLQSFFFVDKKNLKPRRYSDFGTLCESILKTLKTHIITEKDIISIGDRGMFCQSPMRKNFGYDYLTGSLYITKSILWNYCSQNEFLYWDNFEDIEYSVRAASVGIPVIINPYTITQSMNSRSIMHYYGYLRGFSHSGILKDYRSITEILFFIKHKPLFKITIQEAKLKLFRIAKKYMADEKIFYMINQQSLSSLSRLKVIIELIKNIKIPIWTVEEFIDDFEENILCESIPLIYRNNLIEILLSCKNVIEKKNALIRMPFLLNQVSHTLFYSPFIINNDDWLIRKTIFQKIFNKISAFQIKYLMNGVHLKISISEIDTLIDETTIYHNKNKK